MLKKFLSAAAIVALSLPLLGFNFDKVSKAVLPITFDGRNGCTATNINSKMGYWLTAAHCIPKVDEVNISTGEKVVVAIGGKPVTIVKHDEVLDLAIVQVKGLRARSLRLSIYAPVLGQKVYVYGHPVGYSAPQFFQGYISSLLLPISWDGIDYRYMMFDMTVCGGNSGSAVLNNRDEIISVVQIGHGRPCDGFSGGAPWLDLVLFSASYFE